MNQSAQDFFDSANVCELHGRWSEANEHYAKALELRPDFVEAYDNRAGNWVELRDYARAIADYHTVIEYWPDYAAAHNHLALIYLDADDQKYVNPTLALFHAQQACRLTGNNCYESLATCARAFHACYEFGKAIDCQQLAVKIASESQAGANDRMDQITAEMVLPNLQKDLERYRADKTARGAGKASWFGRLVSRFYPKRQRSNE